MSVTIHPPSFFAAKKRLGVKIFDLTGKFSSKLETSNRVIVVMPLFPATKFSQASSTVLPTGVTAPRPVTTTLLDMLLLHSVKKLRMISAALTAPHNYNTLARERRRDFAGKENDSDALPAKLRFFGAFGVMPPKSVCLALPPALYFRF